MNDYPYPQPPRKPAKQLIKERVRKADDFRKYYDEHDIVWDVTLPQTWLENFTNWCKVNRPDVTYSLILSTTVWAYPPRRYGGVPITLCEEVWEAMNAYANTIPF